MTNNIYIIVFNVILITIFLFEILKGGYNLHCSDQSTFIFDKKRFKRIRFYMLIVISFIYWGIAFVLPLSWTYYVCGVNLLLIDFIFLFMITRAEGVYGNKLYIYGKQMSLNSITKYKIRSHDVLIYFPYKFAGVEFNTSYAIPTRTHTAEDILIAMNIEKDVQD